MPTNVSSHALSALEIERNKPPVEQYRFQEYPKAMHHHGKRVVTPVFDANEEKKLAAKGYKTEPFPPKEGYGTPDVELSAEDLAEIAELEKRAEAVRVAAEAKAKAAAQPVAK